MAEAGRDGLQGGDAFLETFEGVACALLCCAGVAGAERVEGSVDAADQVLAVLGVEARVEGDVAAHFGKGEDGTGCRLALDRDVGHAAQYLGVSGQTPNLLCVDDASHVPFLQAIIAGDRGRDVHAVHRTLHLHMGYRRITSRGDKAGHDFEHAIRTVQHLHHLHVDGVYGKKTHAVVAPHFDDRARWLYRHAKRRHRSEYVNPFRDANVQIGRVDEGVDYHGYGPIHAIGDLIITGIGGSGWPGGRYINARLLSGRHAGRYVYTAEAIIPMCRVGQRFKAGETYCRFGPAAAFGLFPGIEYGWSSSVTNLTWAAVTHRTGPPPYSDTPPGLAFARFLHACGAPVAHVGPGPEFV